MPRVLMVDDNVGVTKMCADIFPHYGHEIKTVFNGRGIDHEIQVFLPNVITTDIQGDGLRGEGLLSVLRSLGCNLPVIVCTADERYRGKPGPFSAAVIKPFDIAVLTEVINDVVDGYKPSAKEWIERLRPIKTSAAIAEFLRGERYDLHEVAQAFQDLSYGAFVRVHAPVPHLYVSDGPIHLNSLGWKIRD